MTHRVRDDCDRNHNSETLGQLGASWRVLRSFNSFPGVRAAPSECMSGTLGDVFLFRGNGGIPVVAAAAGVEDHASAGMSLDEKESGGGGGGGGVSNKQCKDTNNSLGNTNIEWQQRLKEGVNANAGSRSMFGDSQVLQQQTFHFMGSIGGGGAGSAGSSWVCPRADSTAVNYLQAFGPVALGSNGGVDGQLGDIRLAADGPQQIMTDVLRRSNASTCEVTADVPVDVKEEEQYGGGADSSSTVGSHVLPGGTISNSGQQKLFGTPRGLMPSPSSMQQLNRSPNHAIRSLFPEKASNFSSAILQQSHDDLGGSKVVDEQGLRQLTKKPRMQDFGDVVPASSPLPISDADNASRLSHGSTAAGHYRKAPPFAHDQRSNALASFINCSSSYSKSSPTSFSPSYAPGDRSTGFNSSNLTSLQNPTSSFSSFQTSRCPPLPMKTSNESISVKSPIVDYGTYALDTTNRMQGGGDYRAELLGPDRDAFLGVSSPRSGLNFMSLGGSMGSGSFNFASCRRQSSLDPLGRSAWPTGLLGSIPSLSMETPSKSLLPSKRTLHDREQSDVLLEDREGRSVHPPEPRKRMLIQKQLTTTDVGSLGRIILPKKEAESYLPHLPDKEGIEMFMYDYEADRTWTVKYRFWPNNKSRMYLLENTGEFAKFHALQQGDWLYIYRESPIRYVLKAKKSAPLLQVTPSSQSVTEASPATAASGGPAVAAAEDVEGPASVSGRTMTMNQSPSPASTTDGGCSGMSSSKDMVAGTTSATSCSNEHSLDVPSSRFSASSCAALGAKCPPLTHIAVPEARKVVPQPHLHPHHPHEQPSSGTSNSSGSKKHLVHHMQPVVRASPGLRGAMEDDQQQHGRHQQTQHQELRLKNYMAVQQPQQPDQDMQSELEGGTDFNLEDFPRLIEADDETIDNILGHSAESQVGIDVRSRSTLSLRGGREEESSSRR